MKKTHSIKTVVAIGIGAAIFVVLSRFASIPSGIPNTSLETAYAVLALIAVLYGRSGRASCRERVLRLV